MCQGTGRGARSGAGSLAGETGKEERTPAMGQPESPRGRSSELSVPGVLACSRWRFAGKDLGGHSSSPSHIPTRPELTL